MPKVYIPNKSVHDFEPAEKFGEVVFLSEGNVRRYNTSSLYRRFEPILKESSPDDYLLVTGLTTLNLIAAFILTKLHGRLNLLLFKCQGNKKFYVERILIGD